jgi:hypothetical protein
MDNVMKLFSILRSQYSNNKLVVSFTRFIASLLGALLFNIPWLILFISFGKHPDWIIRVVLWCLAPLIIASGYSYGIVLYDHIVFSIRDSFLRILPWALLGCLFGEIVTLSSGSMVIGLSIFTNGGIAVLLREFYILHKKKSEGKG